MVSQKNPEPFVYLAERVDGYIKIGYSRYPEERMRSLSSPACYSRGPKIDFDGMTPEQNLEIRKVRLVDVAPGDYRDEKRIHHELRDHRAGKCREWFHDNADARALVKKCFQALATKAQGRQNGNA